MQFGVLASLMSLPAVEELNGVDCRSVFRIFNPPVKSGESVTCAVSFALSGFKAVLIWSYFEWPLCTFWIISIEELLKDLYGKAEKQK